MRVIRKLFYTTLTTFLILTIYTISNLDNNVLRTSLEIEDITNIKTNKVYLLNENNYLTKVDIFLDNKNKKEEVENIFEYLKESNTKIMTKYKGYIPKNSKITDISIKDNTLFLTTSKELLSNNSDIVIDGLIKSLLNIKQIKMVNLNIDNIYQKTFDKSLSINKKYDITSRKNINKIVVYYFNEDNNYIPVTKYTNDNREKVEIIIDELKNNDNYELISYLNSNTKLINYSEENDIMFLNFNKYISDDKNIVNYNLNEIASSIFENYNVSSVMFKENDKFIKLISHKDC